MLTCHHGISWICRAATAVSLFVDYKESGGKILVGKETIPANRLGGQLPALFWAISPLSQVVSWQSWHRSKWPEPGIPMAEVSLSYLVEGN